MDEWIVTGIDTWSKTAKNMQAMRPEKTMPRRLYGTTCFSSAFQEAPAFCFLGGESVVVGLTCWGETDIARRVRLSEHSSDNTYI